MNKRFLLVAALCAAMNLGAFAQENLAQGKTVVASTETANEPASKAVDGDMGTRWQINANDASETSDNQTVTNGHWIYIDLGETKEFNTIRIKWEGAYAKGFEIYTATEMNGEEPKWGEKVYEKNESLSNFDKYYTYKIGTQKARYVKMQATELGYPGNYLSLFEMGVYNITEAATLTKINVSTDVIKVGNTFTVTALDQLDQEMEVTDITVTNAEKQSDGSYKATAAGDIVITAKAGDVTLTKTIQAYTPAITALNASKGFLKLNEETEITFSAKDQKNETMDLTEATYSADNGATIANGKITATKGGKITVTATLDGKTATTVLYGLDETMAPTAPTVDKNNAYGVYAANYENENKVNWMTWTGTDLNMETIKLGNQDVKPFQGGNKIGISMRESDDANLENHWWEYDNSTTKYNYASVQIFATKDFKGKFTAEASEGTTGATEFTAKAGEWTTVEISNVDKASKIKILGIETTDNSTFAPFLVSNLYLYKVAEGTLVISKTADAKGFYTVTGNITSDNLADLKKAEGTAFDLSGATIADDIKKVEFANPNALVMVAGSNNDFTTANKLSETNNVITTDGTYFYAAKTLKFVDASPICTSLSVDASKAETKGYEYTREIAANAWVTTTPLTGADVPTGVEAFELDTENSKDNEIAFKKAESLIAGTPYVLHNTTSEAVTFKFVANTGDFNPTIAPGTSKATNVTFQGNYVPKNGTGAEYGLQKATVGNDNALTFKRIGTGATIGTFRAYFTLNDNTANAVAFSIKFPGNGTTGIGNINAETNAKAAKGIYTLDGRKVSEGASLNNLPKGIYIVNGKKIIK